MKRLFLLILCAALVAGCSITGQETVEESSFNVMEEEMLQQEAELELLNNSLKNEVIKLRSLWNEFDEAREHDVDPTNRFKHSQYLSELKRFLGTRESVALSENQLGELLKQSDYSAVEKRVTVGGETFYMRVIGYTVNFYEQVLTDIPDVKNKWIFVQCWNEQAFYFKTLSDGEVHYFTDFTPFELDNKLYVLIQGNAYPYGPYPAFIWAWYLEKNDFKEAQLFDKIPYENENYILYNSAVFNGLDCYPKWMLHTNGAYLFAERGIKDADDGVKLMNIDCKTNEENKSISFISTDVQGEETVIQLVFEKGKFRVKK